MRQLGAAGHAVTVYHRGEHNAELPTGVRHICRAEATMPIVRFPAELLTPRPDVVVHMIAMGEADARAAAGFFGGRTRRMVWISSGDVYLAYGRFVGVEPGPLIAGLLDENARVRSVLFPYSDPSKPADDLANTYDKILVERIAMDDPQLPGTVLRLPKVYGPGDNADLSTVYAFREHSHWRWTHGYVENVAAAITLAALNPHAQGRIYNVGEEYTPTIEERLAKLPPSEIPANTDPKFNFEQDIAYDTTRIRRELGYREIVPEESAMRMTLEHEASE